MTTAMGEGSFRGTGAGWTVRLVGLDVGEDATTLGLAESPDGDGARVLLLMAARDEPDEQDVELGMDTYCLVDEDQATFYGGLRAARLRTDVLSLHFAEPAVVALGLPAAVMDFALEVPADQVQLLRTGLTAVLSYGSERERPLLDLG